jgi:adenosylmethionine-8-amino-7-oxononanoate aminotransferase
MAPTRIAEVFARDRALNRAQTFSHHPVLCAAGVATIRYLAAQAGRALCVDGSSVSAQAPTLRSFPTSAMCEAADSSPGWRSSGQGDALPFAGAHVASDSFAAALGAGLVVWPNVGHADGKQGDLLMLAPPFIITEDEIDLIVERLGTALEAVDRPTTGAPEKRIPSAGTPG